MALNIYRKRRQVTDEERLLFWKKVAPTCTTQAQKNLCAVMIEHLMECIQKKEKSGGNTD